MEITTIYGPMQEAILEKREGVVDNENEHTTWVEYWQAGEVLADRLLPGLQPSQVVHERDAAGPVRHCVHRSAHITLKKPVTLFGEVGRFGD